eukprot:Gregarina_sp_Poly_1__5555@NODE_2932_length_1537_cov_83_435374_g1848_i0_p1_GENE_NODE_2932_length_1537_cov_83_435374_g1848_i0NODE_2932_length_1537_cov_83_435374_g1848_i0_p1_ORF_typecomplete_len459_score36_19_NODE_2932_length_1537_cov_83_435374_g1848_i0921468
MVAISLTDYDLILENVARFLTASDLWNLGQLNQGARRWLLTPEKELEALVQCFEMCYGLWDADRHARVFKHPRMLTQEIRYWSHLAAILAWEAYELSSRKHNCLTRYDGHCYKFERCESKSLLLPLFEYTLTYFAEEFINFTCGDENKLWRFVDEYDIVSPPKAFRVTPEYANTAGFPWAERCLLRLAKFITDKIPSWEDVRLCYLENGALPIQYRDVREQALPANIAKIPFVTRAALRDMNLLSRLIDPSDTQYGASACFQALRSLASIGPYHQFSDFYVPGFGKVQAIDAISAAMKPPATLWRSIQHEYRRFCQRNYEYLAPQRHECSPVEKQWQNNLPYWNMGVSDVNVVEYWLRRVLVRHERFHMDRVINFCLKNSRFIPFKMAGSEELQSMLQHITVQCDLPERCEEDAPRSSNSEKDLCVVKLHVHGRSPQAGILWLGEESCIFTNFIVENN